ncbi:MAG: 4Fe-4S dicluster domain-containing protein [Proteobacteria bacterium]|nr:4Fe-4S dicluster domain-containing protein [Pseudomonadota bacterium]
MNKASKPNPFTSISDIATINACIQCGTCSGSCPLSDQMDHAPRELFALIREGEYDMALKSNTPWFCVSCYACMVRCPKEIPVTDLMYAFKEIITRKRTAPKNQKMPDMYRAFSRIIKAKGRITESYVMALYGVKHPLDALKNIPLAVKMILRKRLEPKALSVSDPESFARLFELTEKSEDKA